MCGGCDGGEKNVSLSGPLCVYYKTQGDRRPTSHTSLGNLNLPPIHTDHQTLRLSAVRLTVSQLKITVVLKVKYFKSMNCLNLDSHKKISLNCIRTDKVNRMTSYIIFCSLRALSATGSTWTLVKWFNFIFFHL